MKQFLLLSILNIFYLTAFGQTKTWIGPVGGSFNSPDDWNPIGTPGSTNDVIIPAGSNVNLDGVATIRSFVLEGNAIMTIYSNLALSQASSVAADAVLNWESGSLSGTGTITNNGILNSEDGDRIISNTITLINNGTMNINGPGDFYLGYGTPTLNNGLTGTLNLNSTGTFTFAEGIGSVINSGIIHKAQNSGTYEIQTNFTNNNGTISVENGTLNLMCVNASLLGGQFDVSNGCTMKWANNITISDTLSGQISGQLNWTGNLSVEPSTEAMFDFTGPAGISWSGGTCGGNGTLTNSGIITLVDLNDKSLTGTTTTLRNAGIINVNSTGNFNLGYGTPILDNSSSGIINLNSSGAISFAQGIGSLLNTGLIKRSQSAGIFEISAGLTNNNGTFQVEQGILRINNSTVSFNDGTYNVASGSTLELTNNITLSGILTGDLGGQIKWIGTLKVDSGNEAIVDFSGSGWIEWISGNLSGNGMLINRSIINLAGLEGKNITGTTTLKNEELLNINSAGELVVGYGTPTLNNSASGIINLNTDGAITFAQGIGTVMNSGLIKKEGTSGEFEISCNTNNILPGKIISESGLLSFGTYTGNGILAGNGSVELMAGTVFGGTLSPGGLPGTLTHVGNFTSSENEILSVELFGSVPGTQYDVFAVQGNAVVKGNIEVNLNFAAAVNDEFVIFTANSVTICDLPATVTANFDSHIYTFDVICNPANVTLKLNSVVLGMEDTKLNTISLYPNPSNGHFNIDLGKEYNDVTIKISTLTGQTISSEKYNSAKNIQTVIAASPGVYFVSVGTATGESATFRFVSQ